MKSMGYDAADEVLNFKDYLARAGFVEIEETRIQVPVGPWKNTPREKQIGTYFMLNLMEAAEGYLLAP